MDLYGRVRRACHVEGMSKSEAARLFGIDRKTVAKILEHSVPPGYRRSKPPVRPKLDPFIPVIDQILEDDRSQLKKQRHTARRIFERLRDEHGFTGGITIVTDYVREKKRRSREVFVPLSHPPGHAQVDFGEALGVIGGVKRKLHYFAMSLPHSDALFIKAYPAETTEAFCDGHVAAFGFFGGVPASILYDNTAIAVAKILGDGTRKRTRSFSELQSHYLFEDRFGRPGKGNDKGAVEGVIGFGRRNFMVPMPRFESFEALNAWLEDQCLKRQDAVLRGHGETIGERLMRDLDALMPLPAVPYDACEKLSTRATSISMVRYRCNDYSVPVAYAHHEVQVRGYVGEVVIGCGTEVIARHRRSYEKADMVFDPMHFLPLLEQKGEPLERHWSERQWRTPWIRLLLCRVGTCRTRSPRCIGCWKRGWERRESGNTYRSCVCWRPSRWSTSTAPCVRRSIWALSAMTRSSTWSCAASSDGRRGSISTSTPTCRAPGSRPRGRPAT